MKTLIREYRASDLEGLLNTWELATRLAHPFMSDAFIAQERINVAEIYMPNTDTWVAELEGEMTGFIALMGNEVGAIFVQPQYQGQGIGKALMDTAHKIYGELELEVFKVNHIARQFYEKYGFKPLGEKHHQPTGQQVIRLKLTSRAPRARASLVSATS